MDPTAQQTTRPIQQPVPSSRATDTPVPPAPEPVSPVSTHPEQGPRVVDAPSEVVAEPSQPELSLSPELQEAGVDHGADAREQKLSDEVKEAGVAHAKETTPVTAVPTPTVSLPMTQPEALVAKKQSVKKSIRWLAEKVLYFLKQQAQNNPK